jgi:hypothetical protein
MTEVLCNRDDCKNYSDQSCTAKQIGVVDGLCVTKRKVKRGDNYQQLMQPPFNPHCRKQGGGYRSARTGQVLK